MRDSVVSALPCRPDRCRTLVEPAPRPRRASTRLPSARSLVLTTMAYLHEARGGACAFGATSAALSFCIYLSYLLLFLQACSHFRRPIRPATSRPAPSASPRPPFALGRPCEAPLEVLPAPTRTESPPVYRGAVRRPGLRSPLPHRPRSYRCPLQSSTQRCRRRLRGGEPSVAGQGLGLGGAVQRRVLRRASLPRGERAPPELGRRVSCSAGRKKRRKPPRGSGCLQSV